MATFADVAFNDAFAIATSPITTPPNLNPLYDGNLHLWIDDAWPPETAGVDWLLGAGGFADTPVTGLRYGTTCPGGFASLSFATITTNPDSGWSAYRGQYVKLIHGTQTLWEGKIVDAVPRAGTEGVVEFEAGGFLDGMAANETYCRTWLDAMPENWKPHERSPKQYDLETEGHLLLRAAKSRAYAINDGAAVYYWINDGMRDQEATAMTFDWDYILTGDWYFDIMRCGGTWVDEPYNDGVSEYHDEDATSDTSDRGIALSTGSGDYFRTICLTNFNDTSTLTAVRRILLDNVAVHVGSKYGALTSISVHGTAPVVTTVANHLLTTGDTVVMNGMSAGTASPSLANREFSVTVTGDTTFTIASDNDDARTGGYWACTTHPTIDVCMSDVVADVYAATVAYDTEAVGTALGHARIMPFTTAKDALEELASMHSAKIDYGFWDGFTFRCKALPADPSTETTRFWRWDEEDAGYSWDIHTDDEAQVDHVTVLYGDDGTHTYRGAPRLLSVPATPAGADRVVLLDMSDKVLTDAQADAVADQYLLWAKSDVDAGGAENSSMYCTRGDSAVKPTAYVRASDYVVGTHYGATTYLLITATEYDVESATLRITVGGYRPEFRALLSRYGGPRKVRVPHRHVYPPKTGWTREL